MPTVPRTMSAQDALRPTMLGKKEKKRTLSDLIVGLSDQQKRSLLRDLGINSLSRHSSVGSVTLSLKSLLGSNSSKWSPKPPTEEGSDMTPPPPGHANTISKFLASCDELSGQSETPAPPPPPSPPTAPSQSPHTSRPPPPSVHLPLHNIRPEHHHHEAGWVSSPDLQFRIDPPTPVIVSLDPAKRQKHSNDRSPSPPPSPHRSQRTMEPRKSTESGWSNRWSITSELADDEGESRKPVSGTMSHSTRASSTTPLRDPSLMFVFPLGPPASTSRHPTSEWSATSSTTEVSHTPTRTPPSVKARPTREVGPGEWADTNGGFFMANPFINQSPLPTAPQSAPPARRPGPVRRRVSEVATRVSLRLSRTSTSTASPNFVLTEEEDGGSESASGRRVGWLEQRVVRHMASLGSARRRASISQRLSGFVRRTRNGDHSIDTP